MIETDLKYFICVQYLMPKLLYSSATECSIVTLITTNQPGISWEFNSIKD